jgi:exopolyphosphatase/pppGpp-phosphohydrolase
METIKKQLAEYKEQYKQAQMQVVALSGAIQALKRLLQEDENVVDLEQEEEPNGVT